MEKALTKVGSLKVGSLWISKKAKEEFSNISEDISVWTLCIVLCFVPFALPFLCYHCDFVPVSYVVLEVILVIMRVMWLD
jgi:hypothetical protein